MRRAAAAVLALSLLAFTPGCQTLGITSSPEEIRQDSIDLGYKTIETLRVALTTTLKAVKGLHEAGVISEEEKELARAGARRALSAIKAANASMILYLEGSSEKATADDQLHAAERALALVQNLVASWKLRPVPVADFDHESVKEVPK